MEKNSIVIVNWNGVELLKDCLISLSQQTYGDVEIIVVDNGSTDKSVEYVKEKYPGVKVIPLKKNYGFARGCNTGIRHALGDRIVLLNNDTIVDKCWLNELNHTLEKFPDVGFCASKMLNYWKPSVIDAAGDLLGIAKGYKRGNNQPDDTPYNKLEYVFGACAGAAIYRKAVFDRIGLFDESFVSNLEDMDLSFRAQLYGYKCMYVPTAVVYHKVGETKRKIGWSGRLTLRNNKFFWIKNAPLKILVKYFPHLVVGELKLFYGAFKRLLKKFSLENIKYLFVLFTAEIEVVFYLPVLLRKRWKIQKSRHTSVEYIEKQIIKKYPLTK